MQGDCKPCPINTYAADKSSDCTPCEGTKVSGTKSSSCLHPTTLTIRPGTVVLIDQQLRMTIDAKNPNANAVENANFQV